MVHKGFRVVTALHKEPQSLPMAGRITLQMDQATSVNQKILRHHRECSQSTNMDCHYRLRLGCYHKKKFNTDTSLYAILQILSLTLFEKTPLAQLLKNTDLQMNMSQDDNHLNLFN